MRFYPYIILLVLLASILSFPLPPSVHANNLIVPSPLFPTIRSAISAANPGDTIMVSGSPNPYLERLTITKPLHLIGASRDSTIIDGQGLGTVVWINSTGVEIRGFTIRNSDQYGWGIHVENTKGVNITGNGISTSLHGDGVNLYRANNTIVSNNIFTMNLYAVNVTSSQLVRITNNQAVLDDTIGVQLLGSRKNLVLNNTFSGGQEGLDLFQASGNNITRNVIRRMQLAGVLISNFPPNNSQLPQNNTVNENTFQGNHWAIDLQNTTLNTFYHNDFFLNSTIRHVNLVASSATSPNNWDNATLGGRIGGNYWDNYVGTDADNDGVGDTLLPANGVDQHPLMAPFVPVPVFIQAILANPTRGSAPFTVTLSAQILGTLTPFAYQWSFGDGSAGAVIASPVHTYNQPGNYSVTLTVKDSSGVTDSSTTSVLFSVPGASYTIPILLGVLVVAGMGGFLVWRRRKRGRGRPAKS